VKPRLDLPRFLPALLVGLLTLLGACAAPRPSPPAGLEPAERDALVLGLLDGEALYTVCGGLKPVSSGFWQASFAVDAPDLSGIERVRATLAALELGPDLVAGVQVFAEVHEGRRHVQAFVAHRPALRALLASEAAFFGPLGLGPGADPFEVLCTVERMPRLGRFRGYGLLFGYPRHAVDFFVAAAEEEERTGKLPPREFAHIATFGAEKHRFVWAVPPGHVDGPEDLALRASAAPILARYRAQRERFTRDEDVDALGLLHAVVNDVRPTLPPRPARAVPASLEPAFAP
jgi:hypothetical protein